MSTAIIERGANIEVRSGFHTWLLDRDRLETAWLLWFEIQHTPRLAAALRDRHGFAPDSIRYAIAADALHRANISI